MSDNLNYLLTTYEILINFNFSSDISNKKSLLKVIFPKYEHFVSDLRKNYIPINIEPLVFGVNLTLSKDNKPREDDITFMKYFMARKNVALYGPKSYGKTTLAKQFAKEFRQDGGNVIWINSTDDSTLYKAFAKLSRQLRLRNDPFIVFRYFKNSKTLFVFDNVLKSNIAFQLLEQNVFKNSPIVKILLTTLDPTWDDTELFNIYYVEHYKTAGGQVDITGMI